MSPNGQSIGEELKRHEDGLVEVEIDIGEADLPRQLDALEALRNEAFDDFGPLGRKADAGELRLYQIARKSHFTLIRSH